MSKSQEFKVVKCPICGKEEIVDGDWTYLSTILSWEFIRNIKTVEDLLPFGKTVHLTFVPCEECEAKRKEMESDE